MDGSHSVEEIIEALNCFKTRQPKCGECKFNPVSGHNWPYGCIRGQGEIAEEAQKILMGVADGIQDARTESA